MPPASPNSNPVIYTDTSTAANKPEFSNNRLLLASLVMSIGFLIVACISIAAIYFTGIADRALGYSESGIMRDAAVQSLMCSLGIFAVGALLSAAIGWLVWRIIQRILLGDSKAKPYFFSCLAAFYYCFDHNTGHSICRRVLY